MFSLSDINVAVIGVGASGIAAADLLSTISKKVLLSDIRPFEQWPEIARDLCRERGIVPLSGPQSHEDFSGCSLVVLSPGVPFNAPFVEQLRQNGVYVIGELALAASFWKGPIVAITGTNGKSTVTTLVGAMIEDAGFDRVVAGNIGTPLSKFVLDGKQDHIAVLEVSSFQLEGMLPDTEFCLSPTVGVWLNLAPDHIDRHGDMESYARAKASLFSSQGDGDWAVLNADDPWIDRFVPEIPSQKLFFSLNNRDGVSACIDHITSTMHLMLSDDCREIYDLSRWSLIGDHNLENLLAASIASRLVQVPSSVIQNTIDRFHALDHRITEVGQVNGVKFYDDSKATNVAAVVCALKAFSCPVVLIAGGRGKGEDYSILADLSDHLRGVVLYGEERHSLAKVFSGIPAVIIPDDLNDSVVLDSYNPDEIMYSSVKTAMEVSMPGDSVLLSPACASFDLFNNYMERGVSFREAVSRLIRDCSPQELV